MPNIVTQYDNVINFVIKHVYLINILVRLSYLLHDYTTLSEYSLKPCSMFLYMVVCMYL